MKDKIFYSGMFGLIISLVLTSCYPNEDQNVAELDVVRTQYDAGFDFNSRDNFLLADTVPIISANVNYEKSDDEINLDNAILDEIAFQMKNAGYTQLEPADTTDETKMNNALILLTSRGTVSYTGYYYDYYASGYNYWGGYYGLNYYYPGTWNYYYPMGYPVSYSYSLGTVIIEMIDPTEQFAADTIGENADIVFPVRWLAEMNGIAELSYSNTEERIRDGIKQAFKQSSYLYDK